MTDIEKIWKAYLENSEQETVILAEDYFSAISESWVRGF
jgi:hypothetical protein